MSSLRLNSKRLLTPLWELGNFAAWIFYACATGVVVGLAAVAFHYGIDIATWYRGLHPEIILLLPVGGLAILSLYRSCDMERDRGTNLVLAAARSAEPMKLRTAPLIFVSTILTHLLGGSAGREGAALQLGGSMAAWAGERMKLKAQNNRVMVMCGMAAAFSALFGTPLTATVFAMEVVTVGEMQYSTMVPSLMASLVSFRLSVICGLHQHPGYEVTGIVELTIPNAIRIAILGMLCAVLSTIFCHAMHEAPKLYKRVAPDPRTQAALGGFLVLLLTILVGSQDYSGAGDTLIRRMLAGEIIPEAFLLKILFTAVTLGAGFRGGEIVPLLCTGCAFGSWVAPMLGLSSSFGGALGMGALFCGATNCPLASIFLAYELLGGEGLLQYALCCGVAYMLSGYHGLYTEQKLLYSKFTAANWEDSEQDH